MDIAVDSSTLVALLYGQQDEDTEFLRLHVLRESAFLPPPVMSEILSAVGITKELVGKVRSLPLLPIEEGYWQRAGETRRLLLSKKHKARLPDTLIAQSCIDHAIPLLTRDKDFSCFSKYCGLKLALPLPIR